ncbi:ABC transporter ATP-binding protein [Leptolyngbya sp. NK1-12]|uniref:ABC transporter ATP-binding protein n=1 Tax=Leptolyngbya sp. NK1-12 TaxID=2547451 RepID=A0AA96WD93_9CYAN|nr:ABC transporter ATP-binding protein [Leptolyngbya sp. NK1-12]WNZ24142.1 ABC transporter ATP-binding protein [Leptolyngbya sp. NK1-12]
MLQLQSVCKRFGGFHAVNTINLTVQPNELRCLIGPNGAGKSTIFKLLTGVYPVTSGKVLFKGQDITQWPIWRRARHGLSIKMQIPGVYSDLTVRTNMRIAAQNYLELDQYEEINRLLSLVCLDGLANVLVKNLSHGQQQWLELGMALSTQPSLLLLDEPTAGMGPDETRVTGEIVKALHEQGMTILVVEHDMEFVRQIAQRVTVLHYGEIFAEGTLAEIEQREDVIRIYLGKG